MAQDFQLQNTMRERSNFIEHFRSLLQRFAQSLKDQESPKAKLMKELCNLIGSNPDQVASSLIPASRAQLMEDYLCAQGIPHAQIAAQSGMAMFVFDASRTMEINMFYRQCMKLSQGGQKIVGSHDMVDLLRTTHNNIMATFDLENLTDLAKETLLTKLYAGGRGYAACLTDGYRGISADGNPVGSPLLGVEISAVCNSDINQPDLVQACVEMAVNANNAGKRALKDINDKASKEALEKFAKAIESGQSMYLCNNYNSTKNYVEYNAKEEAVYKYDATTGNKVRILDKEDFEEMRSSWDKDFHQSLQIRLSGISDQINNMTCITPEIKADLDLRTMDEINKTRHADYLAAGKGTFELFDRLDEHSTDYDTEISGAVSEISENGCKYIDYNNKSFLQGIQERMEETGKLPNMVKEMLLLNAAEDLAAESVSNYMAEFLTRDINADPVLNTKRALESLQADVMNTPNLFDKAFDKKAVLAKIAEKSPVLAHKIKDMILEDDKTLSNCQNAFSMQIKDLVGAISIKEVSEFERIINKSDEIKKAVKENETAKEPVKEAAEPERGNV